MSDPKTEGWITVADAALLTGRSQRTIYEWVQKELLAPRYDANGILHVLAKAAARTAGERRRGRPRGTPTRR